MSIIGIPNTRVSDQFSRQALLAQVQGNQVDMLRLEAEVSTGRSFQLPSENPIPAMRVMSLQQLLARTTQMQSNVTTNQSYLSETDTAMSQVSSMIADARAAALGSIGSTATDQQRQSAAQQVQQTLQQLVDVGNQKFNGRYLFGGSDTATQPFTLENGNVVRYNGDQNRLSSYGDSGLLFDTNVPGDEAFGVFSAPLGEGVDLNPTVTSDTPLADLFGGQGIPKGSIAVSDGTSTQTIDLSQAQTVGQLVAMIHTHPPTGNTVNVEITPTGFTLQLGHGNLLITDVGSGTTAAKLGILTPRGAGTSLVASADLNPELSSTTRLSDVLGSKATAVLRPGTSGNDIIFTAGQNGAGLNGVTISLLDDPTVQEGGETVAWDPIGRTLTVHVADGFSTAQDIVNAVNAQFRAGASPFQAQLDPLDGSRGGTDHIDVANTPAVVTNYGGGTNLDLNSGLQIANGTSSPSTIDLSKDVTVDDLLATLNASPAGMIAEINARKTGIDVRSRKSGVDLAIGENGGSSAIQLGLRTFTDQTLLSDLNHGAGVEAYQGAASGAFPANTDFTITRSDGVSFSISLQGAKTIGDVLNLINNNATNADPTQGAPVTASLATDGNGIELADNSTGTGHLTVTANPMSTAATDLGLVPKGQQTSLVTSQGMVAQGTVFSTGANNDLLVQAVGAGTQTNGTRIVVQDTGQGAGNEYIHYSVDPQTHVATLTLGITAGTTTAKDLVDLFPSGTNVDPKVRQLFTVGLSSAGGPNTGLGLMTVTPVGGFSPVVGGTATLVTGTDVNPQQTSGLFTALARIQHGLTANDVGEVTQAVAMLDQSTTNFNFARAELGTRQQGLDALTQQLNTENTNLQTAMSADYDVDMTEAVTQLTAKQVDYEASLAAIGRISRYTLLNFI